MKSVVVRSSLVTIGALAGSLAFVSPGKAQNYPWCAVYNVGGPAYNCGFVTYDQCMTTVSGIGGGCERNTQYRPSLEPRAVDRSAVPKHPR
jgi:hypothetical protein